MLKVWQDQKLLEQKGDKTRTEADRSHHAIAKFQRWNIKVEGNMATMQVKKRQVPIGPVDSVPSKLNCWSLLFIL